MKTRVLLLGVVGIVLCAGLLAGCEKKEPAPVTPAAPAAVEPNKPVAIAAAAVEQTECPVMKAPIDKNIFVEYKGKKVYFCCEQCKGDFAKDPEKYVALLPQFK